MIRNLAIGAAVLAVAASAMPAQAQKEIRLGFMTPLSGPLTFLGREQIMGMELALEQLGNKLGGIPVKVFKQDGRMSAATANQAVTKLIEQNKIDILTGLLLSNQTIAISKPVADRGIFRDQWRVRSQTHGWHKVSPELLQHLVAERRPKRSAWQISYPARCEERICHQPKLCRRARSCGRRVALLQGQTGR